VEVYDDFFGLSRDILRLLYVENRLLAMRLEEGGGSAGRSFEKSSHLLAKSPGKRAFLSTIQVDPSCTHQISVTEKPALLIIDRNLAFSSGLTFC
jgi:hypothetical protein